MREIARRGRLSLIFGSIVAALVQFTALTYVLRSFDRRGHTLIVVTAMLAIVSGWLMAALWVTGSAPRVARRRGVMRAATGVLAGIALLFGEGGLTRWMWASVITASFTAIMSFFPIGKVTSHVATDDRRQ